jgi:hypothetical protein
MVSRRCWLYFRQGNDAGMHSLEQTRAHSLKIGKEQLAQRFWRLISLHFVCYSPCAWATAAPDHLLCCAP